MEERELVKLLKDMSLEEKADQLLQLSADFFSDGEILTGPALDFGIEPSDIENAGSVLGVSGTEKIRNIQKNQMAHQRHHIPMLFMADVINGFKTAFPIPLALGASFNPDIAYTEAKIAAKEASVSGLHVTFAPMADLARDARWGRVMESCGEDKYLNSVMTAAMVKGYQGEMAEDGKIANGHLASCVKHFAAYGACEGGRDYNNTEISERTLREDYQMYIRDVTASVIRPVRELKGFKKIELLPNEEKEVVFEITEAMLKFYTAEMIYDSEPGRFEVYIGGSSDAVNKADFVLEQDTCEGGCTYELS